MQAKPGEGRSGSGCSRSSLCSRLAAQPFAAGARAQAAMPALAVPQAAGVDGAPPEGLAAADGPRTGPDDDTEFTIAVLPDTQRETDPASDMRGERRAQWLVEHRQSQDIRLVLSVGDTVQWDTPDHAMYDKASRTFAILERGGIPWLPVVGNHDTAAVCPGGGACPGVDARVAVRDTGTFNRYFPVSRFPLIQGSYEPGKVDNTYSAFRAGGVDWLVVALELWPRPEVVAWADAVVAANPDSNVIVSTHMYVDDRGEIAQDNGGYGATSPQYLYDKLISRHPNIKLVLNGHRGHGTANRVDYPADGIVASWNNTWHSDTTNPVMLLTVDTEAGTVASQTYAPDTDEWFPQGAARYLGMRWLGAAAPEVGAGSRYTPTDPVRLTDTRASGRLGAAAVQRIRVAGAAGVPQTASAASLNVTVTQPSSGGWLRVYPCGDPSATSTLNFTAQQTVANAALVGIGSNGEVCATSSADTHLVVDLMGWYPRGASFTAVRPERLADTRTSGALAAGQVQRVRVAGAAGVPAGARAASLNVTVTRPSSNGWVRVFPCGAPSAGTSTVNFVAGRTVANAALTGIGSEGEICLTGSADTHVVLDLTGWFASTASFSPGNPVRVADTRATGILSAGQVQRVQVAGVGGVPSDARAAAVNVTVTGARSSGWVRVFPCGAPSAGTSNVNFVAGQTVANAVLTGIGSSGEVCITGSADTHVVVDAMGWFD